jgi:hypothetical protein
MHTIQKQTKQKKAAKPKRRKPAPDPMEDFEIE